MATGQHPVRAAHIRVKLLFRWAVPDLYLGGVCELPELLPDLCPALLIQLPRREKQILITNRPSNPAHLQVAQLCSGLHATPVHQTINPSALNLFSPKAPNIRACSAVPVPGHESHSSSANLGFPTATAGFLPRSRQRSYIRGLHAERVLNLTLQD